MASLNQRVIDRILGLPDWVAMLVLLVLFLGTLKLCAILSGHGHVPAHEGHNFTEQAE